MKIKLIISLGIILLCLSCGRSMTDIKGEVFTVVGGQTKKFSGLTIKFIKKEKLPNLNADEIALTDVDYFATSDADGKFSAKIPSGEYIAAADYTERSDGNEFRTFYHHYFWRVPFTTNGNEKKISLDATNGLVKVEETKP